MASSFYNQAIRQPDVDYAAQIALAALPNPSADIARASIMQARESAPKQFVGALPVSQALQQTRNTATPMQAYINTMNQVSEGSSLVGNALLNPPTYPPNPVFRPDLYKPSNPFTNPYYSTRLDTTSSRSAPRIAPVSRSLVVVPGSVSPQTAKDKEIGDYVSQIQFRATPEIKELIKKDMVKRGLISPHTASQGDAFVGSLARYYTGPNSIGSATSYAARVASGEIKLEPVDPILNQDTRSISYDPAAMFEAARQRRANYNAGNPDEMTLKNDIKNERNAIIVPDTVSLKLTSIEAAQSLAKGISDGKKSVENAQADRGIKPLTPPNPPKKAPKKPLKKPKGRR